MGWKKLQLPDTNVLRFVDIPVARLTTRQGAELIVPFHSSFNFYDMLIDIIDETGPYDSIVELGCGYGRNLIEIFIGADRRMCGILAENLRKAV